MSQSRLEETRQTETSRGLDPGGEARGRAGSSGVAQPATQRFSASTGRHQAILAELLGQMLAGRKQRRKTILHSKPNGRESTSSFRDRWQTFRGHPPVTSPSTTVRSQVAGERRLSLHLRHLAASIFSGTKHVRGKETQQAATRGHSPEARRGRELDRQLHRKEAALSETAALLVL